jgi:hypothetical protein
MDYSVFLFSLLGPDPEPGEVLELYDAINNKESVDCKYDIVEKHDQLIITELKGSVAKASCILPTQRHVDLFLDILRNQYMGGDDCPDLWEAYQRNMNDPKA